MVEMSPGYLESRLLEIIYRVPLSHVRRADPLVMKINKCAWPASFIDSAADPIKKEQIEHEKNE